MKPIPVTNFRDSWAAPKGLGGKLVVRKLSLGQMGPTIGQAEIDYRSAVTALEGVKKSFEKLSGLLGKSEAEEILSQARAAVEAAQAEYIKEIPQK